MLTSNNRAKCDICGKFVSWKEIDEEKAFFSCRLEGNILGHVWEIYPCICEKCKENEKWKENENEW
jgi:hypothetical protein